MFQLSSITHLALFLLFASKQATATSKNDAPATSTTPPPPSFDFYVLSMSYQPEFCYQHRHESFPGCESPNEFWKGSLTIHGLWPQVRFFSFYGCFLWILSKVSLTRPI